MPMSALDDRSPNILQCSQSEKAKQIAEAIQDELTRILGNTTRKAKTWQLYITDKTDMTAVIVEVGFLSNPKEEKLLSSSDYQG